MISIELSDPDQQRGETDHISVRIGSQKVTVCPTQTTSLPSYKSLELVLEIGTHRLYSIAINFL